MVSVFVAGSRKFSGDIQNFVNTCQAHNIHAVLPKKELGNTSFEAEKEALFDAFKLIDNSEIVYIYAKDGYIGKTVAIELAYGYAKGKKIVASEELTEYSAKALVQEVVPPESFIQLYSQAS